MFSAEKMSTNGKTVVYLSGVIDENADLDKSIGDLSGIVDIICRDIQRLNSMGIKSWLKYFQGLKAKGCAIRFQECSIAIIEQLNLISNFLIGAPVDSIFVPFVCTKCFLEHSVLFDVEDLKSHQLQVPEILCTRCQSKACFDDIAEDYFSFLIK